MSPLPGSRGAANIRNLSQPALKALYKMSITGTDNVPRSGRVILAANHIGFLDGPVLFAASPRPVHLVAKSEVFVPPLDKVLRTAGQISLDYDSADRDGIAVALEVLEDGRALGIFPEAHRSLGNFASIRHGIAYLHSRTNAPIVPVAILGTRQTGMGKESVPRLRSPIVVAYGEPFSLMNENLVGDLDKRATLAGLGEAIRQRLADHVAQAVRTCGVALPTDAIAPPQPTTAGS